MIEGISAVTLGTHVKAVSITLQPDEKSGVSAAVASQLGGQRHPLPDVRID
jgi:hypothetical protein